MDTKPGDLFLSVIEFFGILIPGALFVALNKTLFLQLFSIPSLKSDDILGWIFFFGGAFVFGHFIHGISYYLNKIAIRCLSPTTREYWGKIKGKVILPNDNLRSEKKKEDVYHSAFSYIRIYSPNALVELERQTAEYKLFRSLTLLFLFDIPLSYLNNNDSTLRIVTDVALAALAYWRFDFLFDWSFRLACDFFLQLTAHDKNQ